MEPFVGKERRQREAEVGIKSQVMDKENRDQANLELQRKVLIFFTILGIR